MKSAKGAGPMPTAMISMAWVKVAFVSQPGRPLTRVLLFGVAVCQCSSRVNRDKHSVRVGTVNG
jgi:hypothetical protein